MHVSRSNFRQSSPWNHVRQSLSTSVV